MNNSYYSGSSYYDEEDVSMRSDPPVQIPNEVLVVHKQASYQAVAAAATHAVSLAGAGLTTNEQNDSRGTKVKEMLELHSNQSFKFEKSVEDGKILGSKRSQQTLENSEIAEKVQLDSVDSDKRELTDGDLKAMKVSDILQGNYAPLEIPMLEIPGCCPLIYNEPEALLAEINEKDEFMVDDLEEEFFMFTAEIIDAETRAQDGPFQTLRWRKRVRNYTQKGHLSTTEESAYLATTSGQQISSERVKEAGDTEVDYDVASESNGKQEIEQESSEIDDRLLQIDHINQVGQLEAETRLDEPKAEFGHESSHEEEEVKREAEPKEVDEFGLQSQSKQEQQQSELEELKEESEYYDEYSDPEDSKDQEDDEQKARSNSDELKSQDQSQNQVHIAINGHYEHIVKIEEAPVEDETTRRATIDHDQIQEVTKQTFRDSVATALQAEEHDEYKEEEVSLQESISQVTKAEDNRQEHILEVRQAPVEEMVTVPEKDAGEEHVEETQEAIVEKIVTVQEKDDHEEPVEDTKVASVVQEEKLEEDQQELTSDESEPVMCEEATVLVAAAPSPERQLLDESKPNNIFDAKAPEPNVLEPKVLAQINDIKELQVLTEPVESEVEKQFVETIQLEACSGIVEDQMLQRELLHTRHVQIDSLRPVYDQLEQMFVKEIESIWINETMLLNEALAARQVQQSVPNLIEARKDEKVDNHIIEEKGDFLNASPDYCSEKLEQKAAEATPAEATVAEDVQIAYGNAVNESPAQISKVNSQGSSEQLKSENHQLEQQIDGDDGNLTHEGKHLQLENEQENDSDYSNNESEADEEPQQCISTKSDQEKEDTDYPAAIVQNIPVLHLVKAKNSTNPDYVRRTKQPKFMDKQKMKAKLQNAAQANSNRQDTQLAPKFKTIISQELIPLARKKPRPPVLAQELRASSQSPTPMMQLRQSMERISSKNKKPRVPKVAELLPGAKLIVPIKVAPGASIEESPGRPDRKEQSPHTLQKKIQSNTLNAKTNPSLTNIHNQYSSTMLKQQNVINKSPSRGSFYTSDKKISQKQQKYLTQQRYKRLQKKPSKVSSIHSSVEDKFGSVRVVKPQKLRSQQQRNYKKLAQPEFESESKSYLGLPAGQFRTNGSPESTIMMPPLIHHYNSKQPYEQQLVSQLLTAYRPNKNNMLPQTEFRPTRAHGQELRFTTSTTSFKPQVDEINMLPDASSFSFAGRHSSLIKQQKTQQPQLLLRQADSFSSSPFRGKMRRIPSKLAYNTLDHGSYTLPSNPHDSEPDIDVATDTFTRNMMPMMSEKQAKNATFHAELRNNKIAVTAAASHNSSFQQIPLVKPAFGKSMGNRKKSIEALNGQSKAAIYELLAQNSQAFLKQEKTHIDGFRKAQSIQKKTLNMIIQSTSKTQLAPLRSTAQHIQETSGSVSKLPSVQAISSTYAAMAEYGSTETQAVVKDSSSSFNNRNVQKMQMRLTNQSEQARYKTLQKSISRGPVGGASTAYPIFSVKDDGDGQSIYKAAAGIPSLNSGGRARQRLHKDNGEGENFFPSFDSRGNTSIIQDSYEFSGRYPKQLSMLHNAYAPKPGFSRAESISEIDGATSSDHPQMRQTRDSLPTLPQKITNSLMGVEPLSDEMQKRISIVPVPTDSGYEDDQFDEQ